MEQKRLRTTVLDIDRASKKHLIRLKRKAVFKPRLERVFLDQWFPTGVP